MYVKNIALNVWQTVQTKIRCRWSESTLHANAYLSQYLGLLRYSKTKLTWPSCLYTLALMSELNFVELDRRIKPAGTLWNTQNGHILHIIPSIVIDLRNDMVPSIVPGKTFFNRKVFDIFL